MVSMQEVLSALFSDSRSLWIPQNIQEYQNDGETISFLRDHVGQSVPCVWRGAATGWSALQKWPEVGFEYLRERVGKRLVEVAVTPDGRADAILDVRYGPDGETEKVFAMPHQKVVPFERFLDDIRDVPAGHAALGCPHDSELEDGLSGVPYYSAQDASLTREVPELLGDIDESTVQFAEAAFGSKASAINIWVGDGRSLTTMHADPFENLYAVVTGTKIFELRPPSDAAFLPKPSLKRVRWVPIGSGEGDTEKAISNTGHDEDVPQPRNPHKGWRLVREEGTTEWIDEENVDTKWHQSVIVQLNPGDLLYLPGLWCEFNRN